MRVGAVLLAAGSGRRFGKGPLKQLRSLGTRPLFFWPLRTFNMTPEIREIILVVPREAVGRFKRLLRRWPIGKFKAVVPGGQTRNESVCYGVRALSQRLDVVLVHDAVRPLVSVQLTRQVLSAAKRFGASLAAMPLKDTLKTASAGGFVKRTIPREGLWMAQTPQAFRRSLAQRWFARPTPSVTDDVQVFERSGVRVKLVPGSPWNLKVTYPEDLELCRSYIKTLKI